jgi:two-component system chemotaxis sensor kinase CheA
LRVVAHPGLTTAAAVTTLSGRGVGVDVVNTRVRTLGGRLALESVAGQGTVFTLRLPVTIAITRALLVEISGRAFAIPAVHVEECLAYHESLQVHHDGGAAVTVRDEVVPLVALDERFGLRASSASGEDDEQHLAIVEQGGKRAALRVDALVGQQDIVVKPLDPVHGATPWFSGATVLGDGRLALILDVVSLL